jgi:predicted transposase/invertase (TIGR01784 family)
MRFIDPKTDFAFKKIFGSDQSHAILISFLNSLIYNGDAIVQELEILNPYQAPKIVGIKATYLDVRAKLCTGEWVIIEMQVLNVAGFEKRVLYNAAKAYAVQLDSGAHYTTLNPVIALTITDFEMFPEFPEVMSRFVLKERNTLVDYPSCDIELIFAELPKFTLSIDQLLSVSEKWLYFLKNAPNLETVPLSMDTIPELHQAFEIAQQSNLNRDELEELEKQQIYIQDQRGVIIKATETGLQQGLKQGRQDEKIEIAKRLLDLLDDATIAATTGLSPDEIQALRV